MITQLSTFTMAWRVWINRLWNGYKQLTKNLTGSMSPKYLVYSFSCVVSVTNFHEGNRSFLMLTALILPLQILVMMLVLLVLLWVYSVQYEGMAWVLQWLPKGIKTLGSKTKSHCLFCALLNKIAVRPYVTSFSIISQLCCSEHLWSSWG